jgi:hypothetical protein
MESRCFVLGVASQDELLQAVRQLPFVRVSSDGSMHVRNGIELKFFGPEQPTMLMLVGLFQPDEVAAVRSLSHLEDERTREAASTFSRTIDEMVASRGGRTRVEVLHKTPGGRVAGGSTDEHPPHRGATDPPKMESGANGFRCDRCYRPLRRLDRSLTVVVGDIGQPVIYEGVRCSACGKVECAPCKGEPRPCSWCGGRVAPAYERDPNSNLELRFAKDDLESSARGLADLLQDAALEAREQPSILRRLTSIFKKRRDF